MTLTEKIQTELIGSSYPGVYDMEESLSAIVGKRMSCYDSRINDGADDDETEDQYVICSGFSSDDDSIIVRVYYGDVTQEIGYVDVVEPAV